jgi:hypothetical protein
MSDAVCAKMRHDIFLGLKRIAEDVIAESPEFLGDFALFEAGDYDAEVTFLMAILDPVGCRQLL